MAQEPFAQDTFAQDPFRLADTQSPDTLAENDYRSFCDALGMSARGRAFLHEYARRNRHADTEVVLAALARLQETARAQQAAPEAERIRQDLRALLDTLHSARPQVDNSPGAIKAATLAALIDFTQARIEALLIPARATLEEVPSPEQPELPIPRPAPMPTVISLVQAAMAAPVPEPRQPPAFVESVPIKAEAETAKPLRLSEIIPKVNFIDGPPVKTAPQAAAAPKPPAEPYELWLDPPQIVATPKPATAIEALAAKIAAPAVSAMPAPAPPAPAIASPTQAVPADPLAVIMALSEAERLALFT
jgi:hypothetical protein